MKKSTRFPLFIDMEDRYVIVFGAGKIAARRVEVLLNFNSRVTVVAPEFSKRLLELKEANPSLQLVFNSFEEWERSEGFCGKMPFCVLAATNNSSVNKDIANAARAAGIIVNVCDNAADCDFYFPAVIHREQVVVGIAGNGENHRKVRETADELRTFFADKSKLQ